MLYLSIQTTYNLKYKHKFKYFVITPGFLLRFFPKDGSVSLSYMVQVVEENDAFVLTSPKCTSIFYY